MADKLTPQQKCAVENRGGKLLVSAAAGSGKTKVLVDRLMSYMTDPADPANLDDFLIITYTKAAASELRGKISDKLTAYIAEHPDNRHMQQQIQRLHMAKISTVHGFCGDILREYAYRLDISADFRIAEEAECQEMMYQILEQLLNHAYSEKLENEAFRAFVDTQGLGRDDRQVPEIILQIYSSALCHLDPNAWLDNCLAASRVEGVTDAADTIWGRYLMKDLKVFLGLQIQSLETCIHRISDVPGLEKPAILLSATAEGLRSLERCRTWDEVVNHPPIEYGTLTFKKEHKGTFLSEQIKAVRNSCKEALQRKLQSFSDSSKTVLEHLAASALAAQGLSALVKDFREQYDRQKRNRRVLDFSDLEQLMLDLLLGKGRTGITSAALEIGERFREIMVDEYQDSNAVQDAIFSALTHKRQNCFMVGDVKQSIYQFRLADPEIFLNKYNSFQPAGQAAAGEGRKVLLSSNFRSSNGVISAVNDVFQVCMSPKVGGLDYGEEEMLREGIPHLPLPDREVSLYGIDVQEDTYQEEATFTAQHIKNLLEKQHMVRQGDTLRPIIPDDIVILLRSPGSVGGEFRYALELLGIPVTMGTDVDLLETPEIETLRSILQVIHNPLQDIPLIASLTSPVLGFSADELAGIRSNQRYTIFYKALESSNSEKAISCIHLLDSLRSDARFLTVTQLIYQIFLKTGMLSIYGAMEDGQSRVQNLQSFCQIAADFEGTGRKDLSYFLDYLTAMEDRGLSVAGSAPTGAVRIMSIHKSKGLEFPVVYLCGLSRSFNMTDSQKQVLCHKELGLGLSHTNAVQRVRFPTIAKRAIAAKIAEESISEELRVLYVAMTRAKDRLIMTYAAARLADKLGDLTLRMDMCCRELLASQVHCPGSWVLLTALRRTEAGEFFNISYRPDSVQVSEIPWDIRIAGIQEAEAADAVDIETREPISQDTIESMQRGLKFQYPWKKAIEIPSKLTATQLKGRAKDQEAAEFAGSQRLLPEFRYPSVSQNSSKGAEYGSAMHKALQYLNFSSCSDETEILQDLHRMTDAGLISRQQAEMVDVGKIAAFFQTALGKQLKSAEKVLREFKFSILEDAATYYEGVSGDSILLQGVIDCALIEEDGIVILDFKTDFITNHNLQEKNQQYRAQVLTYARALSRIYQLPVKNTYIYYFSNGQLVAIK